VTPLASLTGLTAHPLVLTVLAAGPPAQTPQQPEDVGKAGPTGLALLLVLAVAVFFLARSMSRHLKRVPRSFDDDDDGPPATDLPRVPDTPAELFEQRRPGEDLLEELRRAPRAIEGPRRDPPAPDGEPRG
jgi:HAMP domain-containing protein